MSRLYNPLIFVMSKKNKPNFINERPLKNKYCIMTTVHMLEACRESYNKTLHRLEAHLDGITQRYYTNGVEVPPDIRKEISTLNTDIVECDNKINSIENAINVIGTTYTDNFENEHD